MSEEQFLDDVVVNISSSNVDTSAPLPEYEKLPAIVKKIVKTQVTYQGNVSDKAKFTFEIVSDKFKGRYAWGSVGFYADLPTKSTLYKWACNMLGVKDLATSFAFKELKEKPVYIIIKNSDKKNKDGQFYQNVKEVLAADDDLKKTAEAYLAKTTEELVQEETVVVETEEITKVEEPAKATPPVTETKDEPEDEISEDDLPF